MYVGKSFYSCIGLENNQFPLSIFLFPPCSNPDQSGWMCYPKLPHFCFCWNTHFSFPNSLNYFLALLHVKTVLIGDNVGNLK